LRQQPQTRFGPPPKKRSLLPPGGIIYSKKSVVSLINAPPPPGDLGEVRCPNLGLRQIFFLHTNFSETARIEGFCIETLIGNRRAQFLKPVFPCGPGPSRDHPKQVVLVLRGPAQEEEHRKGKKGIPKYRIRASGEFCMLGIESQMCCTERLAHATDTVPGSQDWCGGKL